MNRLILMTSALLLTGCYKMTYLNGPMDDGVPDKVITHHTFVGGMIEQKPVMLDEHCSTGVRQIDHEYSITNFLFSYGVKLVASMTGVGALPVQWYYPHTINIHCNDGSTAPSGAPKSETGLDALQKQIEDAVDEVEEEIEVDKLGEELGESIDEAEKELEKELDSE